MRNCFKELFIKPGILGTEEVPIVKNDRDPQIKEIYEKHGKMKDYDVHKKEWKLWRNQNRPLKYDRVTGKWSGKEKPCRFSTTKRRSNETKTK